MIKYLEHPWDIIQLDAVAFPGNSGSPVYRIATGQVVGVINKVFVKGKKNTPLKNPRESPMPFLSVLSENLTGP